MPTPIVECTIPVLVYVGIRGCTGTYVRGDYHVTVGQTRAASIFSVYIGMD